MLWNLVHFILCLKCQCLAGISAVIFGALHTCTVSEPRACPSRQAIRLFLGLREVICVLSQLWGLHFPRVKIMLNNNLLHWACWIFSQNQCTRATEGMEPLCLVMHLYGYLGSNSTSTSLLRCKSGSWGGECRSHVLSACLFMLIQNLSILIYIFTGEGFYGLEWSFQAEEETANSGSISLRWSLCTQICCLLCMWLL